MFASKPGIVRRVDGRTREILGNLLALGDVAEDLVARGRALFDADPLLRLAAEAITLRVGSLTSRLPADFKAANPQVNWTAMQETRDAIQRGFTVDYDLLWIVMEQRRPANAQAIREIVDRADS